LIKENCNIYRNLKKEVTTRVDEQNSRGKKLGAHPLIPLYKDGHLWTFLFQKCEFLPKVKEIKGLRGGVLGYATQEVPKIDAEIG